MKKILLAAMSVLAFTACTQSEDFENATQNREMKFNTAVMKTTRATAITNTDFKTFKLQAYVGSDQLIGETVFTGGPATWTAGITKFYWPGDESVTFYGYSVTSGDAAFNYNSGVPKVSYTVKTTAATQEDLLVSTVTKKYSDPIVGAVELSFSHILTKMAFKVIETEGATYEVESAKISAKGTGEYLYSGTWTATGANLEYALGITNKKISTDDTFMMIPQADATLTVVYTYKIGNVAKMVTKTLDFPTWAKGTNMLYTITLDGAKEMTITGRVSEDWTSPATDGGKLTEPAPAPAE